MSSPTRFLVEPNSSSLDPSWLALGFPGLDSSSLQLKVLIPLWTQTPYQFGLASSIFFLNSFKQLTRVTFTLSAYPISPDWLTWIMPEQLTWTPSECLTRSHQCLPGLIHSYPAELLYLILLPIGLLLTRPYTVLPGQITLPDSSPNQTSTYLALHGLTRLSYLAAPNCLPSLTQSPYPVRYPSTNLTWKLPP
jgi:hypothetical protein